MSLFIISILIYAALYDLRDCKIPNMAVIAIIVIGLIQASMMTIGISSYNSITLPEALLGLFLGLAICIPLHYFGFFGAGDAKLLASLGTVFGYQNIILIIASAIAAAGVLAFFRLVCYGEITNLIIRWYNTLIYRTYQPPKTCTVASSAVPMGGAILLSTMYCHFYLL